MRTQNKKRIADKNPNFRKYINMNKHYKNKDV